VLLTAAHVRARVLQQLTTQPIGSRKEKKSKFSDQKGRVADPDPDRMRIQSGQWIRIRIRNPDPDPGGKK
jgi:hypothetical protein